MNGLVMSEGGGRVSSVYLFFYLVSNSSTGWLVGWVGGGFVIDGREVGEKLGKLESSASGERA